MQRQPDLTQYFNFKKVKLNEEPPRLLTPTFSDAEDADEDSKSSHKSNFHHSTMQFHSPFSQFKTMAFSTRSDFAPKLIPKTRLTFSPDRSICHFPYTITENNKENKPQAIPPVKMKNGTLDKWVQRRGKNDSWPYLPKEIIYRIFHFLHLRDCANASLVCRFWKLCYHNIYFNYSFLKEFDSDRFSVPEMATVFKKAGSKMKHIRKIREILKGQRLEPLMQRARVSALLSNNSEHEGSLLESFRLEPKRAGLSSSVFLTDKALISICNDSNQSLQFISLASCQFVTCNGFEGLRKCVYLQYINIHNNSHLNDSTLGIILKELPRLHTLMIAKCSGITSEAITIIGSNCPKLERLDIGSNSQISFEKISLFSKVKHLGSLSVRQTSISNQEIQNLLVSTRQVHSLNLSGCLCVTDMTLGIIRQHGGHLQRLNIACIPNLTQNELNLMVESLLSLKVLYVNNNLYSQRIEELLKLRNQ